MWKQKYELISFEEDEDVLIVRFARHDNLNAINARLHTEMSRLFRDIAEHSACKSVVLTGQGRAFCAGGDIDWFANMQPGDLDRLFVEARRIIVDMLEVPQPIITAINGPAIGLGVWRRHHTHVLAGIAAGDGGASIWPWIVGMPRAKEFLFTGKKINADLARELGLVNHITSDDDLMPAALEMAHRLAGGAQMAIRATKASLNKILRETVNLNLDTSLAMEKECFFSEEHKIAAFLKRSNR